MVKPAYIVVFDFDETIGSFYQPYKFWIHLKKFLKDENINIEYFFSFLDLFPYYFRPNIFKIFKFLKKKKESNLCDSIIIYTNNIGPNSWVDLIVSYIHKKLNYNY